MSLIIDSKETGPESISFSLQGEIDQHSYESLEETLTQATEGGLFKIRIELSKVSYISSAGIGVLVGCAGRVANESEGSLELLSPSQSVMNVLDSMGFSQFFTIISGPAQQAPEGTLQRVAGQA